MESEIIVTAYRYKNENREDFYDQIITHNSILCEKDRNGVYTFKQIFI